VNTGTVELTDAVLERVQRRLVDDDLEPTPRALAQALRAESAVLVSDAEMLRLIIPLGTSVKSVTPVHAM